MTQPTNTPDVANETPAVSTNPIDAFLTNPQTDTWKSDRQAEFDAQKALIDERYVKLFTTDKNTNNSDGFDKLTASYWGEIFALHINLAKKYVNRLFFVDYSTEDQVMLIRAKLYELETLIRS